MNIFRTIVNLYFLSFVQSIFWSPLTKHLKNSTPKLCKNCAHFISNGNNPEYSKCELFGNINLVTGETRYKYADLCRSSECGIDAIYFEAKNVTDTLNDGYKRNFSI